MAQKPKYDKLVLFGIGAFFLLIFWAVLVETIGGLGIVLLILGVLGVIGFIYWRFRSSRQNIVKTSRVLGEVAISVAETTNKTKNLPPKYARDEKGNWKPEFIRVTVPKSMRNEVERNANYQCQMRDSRTERCPYTDINVRELHHINGKRGDNRIANLIVLCANHHKRVTAAFNWRIKPDTNEYEYTTIPKTHAQMFNYMRRNDDEKIASLNQKYFIFDIQKISE